MAQVNHVLNMILDHQLSRDWRGTCERCVPGRKLLHPEEADVESAGEREDAADTTGWEKWRGNCALIWSKNSGWMWIVWWFREYHCHHSYPFEFNFWSIDITIGVSQPPNSAPVVFFPKNAQREPPLALHLGLEGFKLWCCLMRRVRSKSRKNCSQVEIGPIWFTEKTAAVAVPRQAKTSPNCISRLDLSDCGLHATALDLLQKAGTSMAQHGGSPWQSCRGKAFNFVSQ